MLAEKSMGLILCLLIGIIWKRFGKDTAETPISSKIVPENLGENVTCVPNVTICKHQKSVRNKQKEGTLTFFILYEKIIILWLNEVHKNYAFH